MSVKKKANKEYKNHSVLIVEDDCLACYPVVDFFGDSVEYENGVLKIEDGQRYFDSVNGGICFVYNLDLPAKVEAENLKTLRRSSAIHNIFSFDRHKKLELMSFMPWIIIILLVLFKH